MASYKLEWKQSARRELKKLQKKTISRILQIIETLPDNPYPSGSRKLHGAEYTMPIRLTQVGVLGYDPTHVRLPPDSVRVSASLP